MTETEPIRIAVLGCGAIGSLYAAHLARNEGVEVWGVDPWVEHVAAIEANGLQVIGHAEFVAPVRATVDPRDLPPCQFAIVATKARCTVASIDAPCCASHLTAIDASMATPMVVSSVPTIRPISSAKRRCTRSTMRLCSPA